MIRNRYICFKQARLTNKYTLTEDVVTEVFEQSLEVDIVRNRYKVHGLTIPRPIALIEDTNL